MLFVDALRKSPSTAASAAAANAAATAADALSENSKNIASIRALGVVARRRAHSLESKAPILLADIIVRALVIAPRAAPPIAPDAILSRLLAGGRGGRVPREGQLVGEQKGPLLEAHCERAVGVEEAHARHAHQAVLRPPQDDYL